MKIQELQCSDLPIILDETRSARLISLDVCAIPMCWDDLLGPYLVSPSDLFALLLAHRELRLAS